MSNNDWYRYYAPRRIAALTPDSLAADRAAAEDDLDFVLDYTGLQPHQRTLEIGCGWGRHSLALAQRGFDKVTSIDIAPEPLQLAQALASEQGLACEFHRQDFMHVSDGPYDAVLSLYDRSCCGFPSEEEDLQSLRHLARLLRPGGWLSFGINDWPFALPEASQHWAEVEDGVELVSVIPDRVRMTCTDQVTLIRHDGRRESHSLTRRHYYLPELRRLLALAGFELQGAFHGLKAAAIYGDGSDGLFLFARRT